MSNPVTLSWTTGGSIVNILGIAGKIESSHFLSHSVTTTPVMLWVSETELGPRARVCPFESLLSHLIFFLARKFKKYFKLRSRLA